VQFLICQYNALAEPGGLAIAIASLVIVVRRRELAIIGLVELARCKCLSRCARARYCLDLAWMNQWYRKQDRCCGQFLRLHRAF